MQPTVYYRAPAGSVAVPLRSDRPGRRKRYHQGARVGSGPLLTPEACNLDNAVHVYEVSRSELVHATPSELCRRCFRHGLG